MLFTWPWILEWNEIKTKGQWRFITSQVYMGIKTFKKCTKKCVYKHEPRKVCGTLVFIEEPTLFVWTHICDYHSCLLFTVSIQNTIIIV